MKIAIIGYGTSCDGKGFGEKIDACDLVVRFCCTDLSCSGDYGTRYDAGVMAGPWGLERNTALVKHLPSQWWMYWLRLGRRWNPPNPLLDRMVLQHDVVVPEIESAGLAPTRGLCAVMMACKFYRPNTVILVGFDSLMSGKQTGYGKHYSWPGGAQLAQLEIGATRNGRHDFELEHKILCGLPARIVDACEVWL